MRATLESYGAPLLYADGTKIPDSVLNRTFSPPERLAIPAIQRRWEALSGAEEAYEAALNSTLGQLKKVGPP